MNQEIYLRRRNKVVLPDVPTIFPTSSHIQYVASVVKNFESLGYTFSKLLSTKLTYQPLDSIVEFYEEVYPILKKLKGAHRTPKPMYPNFPKQVMEMDEVSLYINAIVHYISGGTLLPLTEKKERFPLIGNYDLTVIDLGTEKEFNELFGQILSSNTSLSEQDKEDLNWFVQNTVITLPESIPQKENLAYFTGLTLKEDSLNKLDLSRFYKTATDVLRLAVTMSNGDVSLADNTKFRNFTRKERKFILSLLESIHNPLEDMLRYREVWKRLGHKLHVGEFKKAYPNTVAAFDKVRNDKTVHTFNGKVEKHLASSNVEEVVALLSTRPGEFARRLDHILRLESKPKFLKKFEEVADKVSTPVLLQLRSHFLHREVSSDLRVFFPKGNLAKAHAIKNELSPINSSLCNAVVEICDETLKSRFSQLPSYRSAYVDPALKGYLVPFSQRSASKALKTIVRGSRIKLDDSQIARFFIWWKNIEEYDAVDIDLSALFLDENFKSKGVISYYNLKDLKAYHSGDITNAPYGASEFIDIDIDKAASLGNRYLVMVVNSYSNDPFVNLPECFAGWMGREDANSGEIFEAKTVQNKADLTANTTIAIPLIIDLVEREVIWVDLALKSHPDFSNNVHNNEKGLSITTKALVEMRKPNLYDLFKLHAEARGFLVEDRNDAEVVFAVDEGIQYELEKIASEYMA